MDTVTNFMGDKMTNILRALLIFAGATQLAIAAPIFAADEHQIELLVLGTFHFDNPGQDIANTQVDDVLEAKRQAEIALILDGLARFKPSKIAVESQRRQPGSNFSEKYPEFRAGKMGPSANEVVQLGFALAKRLGHQNVYSVDVSGEFPFEAVMAFAQRTGQGEKLGSRIAAIQSWTADIGNQLKSKTLAAVLREFNEPAAVAQGNAFYLDMLQYGAVDEQPGAELVSRWYERNVRICARIVQSAQPGDRILVVYGSGHSYLLRHCLGGAPGFRIIEANDYLPK
jgi:Family of unknown function (DUF5694)